jgi:transcriptional regulator of arginine metabolism
MSATPTTLRRQTLRKLLLSDRGGTQFELCDLLADRGFTATQSTVSRDLKLLGAQRRVREDGSLVYRLESARANQFPAQMVLAVVHNESLILMRTRVGRAPAVGIELDGLRHPDVLGTLAGDDTVMVIPTSVRRIPALLRTLRALAELEDS